MGPVDNKIPSEEKQQRDTNPGQKSNKPHGGAEQHVLPETHIATGENRPGNFPRDPAEKAKLVGKDNPEIYPNVQQGQQGPVAAASGANTSYDKVVEGRLGDQEVEVKTDKA